MPKRRADEDDDDPEWAHHLGHFQQGSINTLWDKDPRGKPAEKAIPSIGFRLRKARSSADRIRRKHAKAK
jgi:hypothetical protein